MPGCVCSTHHGKQPPRDFLWLRRSMIYPSGQKDWELETVTEYAYYRRFYFSCPFMLSQALDVKQTPKYSLKSPSHS